ncbi:MAG: UDP-N-acetylglucosamine 2-epimerase [Patescibacteria group bacterium]
MKTLKNKKRKILFVSERRADYSRLKPIMKAVNKSQKLEMQLLVTGMHLLKYFGETKKVVKDDGFRIDAILPVFAKNDQDDGANMVRGMSRALAGMPGIFTKLNPDIVFTGFDIGCNFAAAITAMHLNIHVAHIQGGEVSGTIDEVIRHGLTKFAHIHFAATKQSVERIIKMGEDPKYVFNVGCPSLDTMKSIEYFSKEEIFKKYGLDKNKNLIVFSQHPVTSEVDQVEEQITTSMNALKEAIKKYNAQAIAIYSNNDAGGKRIVEQLKKSGIMIFAHIVNEDYFRLLKVANVLVGNSSTGIHEAPSLKLPAVNIGTREQLRERGFNVIDVDYNKDEIVKAIKKAIFDKEFIKKVQECRNPYDNGRETTRQVVRILEDIDLPSIQKVITY